MKTYRKKPVVIEACQWDGSIESAQEICDWANPFGHPMDEPTVSYMVYDGEATDFLIWTLEGDMTVSPMDWVIKGVSNEFYPCKPDIFEKTYEETQEGVG